MNYENMWYARLKEKKNVEEEHEIWEYVVCWTWSVFDNRLSMLSKWCMNVSDCLQFTRDCKPTINKVKLGNLIYYKVHDDVDTTLFRRQNDVVYSPGSCFIPVVNGQWILRSNKTTSCDQHLCNHHDHSYQYVWPMCLTSVEKIIKSRLCKIYSTSLRVLNSPRKDWKAEI